VQTSTIHPIILLYKLLFMVKIKGHDCTGGEIDGIGSVSDGLRWVGEIGEVTEGMNLFGFF
jgi:hypothetical protein